MSHHEINILSADPDGDYRLRLRFDDGAIQTVDFLPFLSRTHHPDIRAFLDPGRFASFRLEYGELVWGDFALCFPAMDLYRGGTIATLDKADSSQDVLWIKEAEDRLAAYDAGELDAFDAEQVFAELGANTGEPLRRAIRSA